MSRVIDALAPAARPIDFTCDVRGWYARLVTALDAEAAAFERELLAEELPNPDDPLAARPLELAVQQRLAWIRVSSLEHRLFQLRDPKGRAAMQAVLRIARPRRMPLLGRASAYKLGSATSPEAEAVALTALRDLALATNDLVSLRLQPYRLHTSELLDFEGRARRAGYRIVEPIGVTRTLLVDLRPSLDQLLAGVSSRTRSHLRERRKAAIEVRVLSEPRHAAACRALANEAMARTGGGVNHFDFKAAFALAAADPQAARILGLFFADRPDQLMAFVCGLRHGDVVEYAAGGSAADPELRAMSFSYWLLWDLFAWGKEGGARWFDMGGVTDGGEGDAVAGISTFKRHFSRHDVEVGRELILLLQPTRARALELWSQLRGHF